MIGLQLTDEQFAKIAQLLGDEGMGFEKLPPPGPKGAKDDDVEVLDEFEEIWEAIEELWEAVEGKKAPSSKPPEKKEPKEDKKEDSKEEKKENPFEKKD
jgi:hypothetical protein